MRDDIIRAFSVFFLRLIRKVLCFPMRFDLQPIHAVKAVLSELEQCTSRHVEVAGPWGTAKTLVAVQTAEALGVPVCVLTADRAEAEAVFEDLATFAGEERVVSFPAWEVLPTDAMDPADDIVAERMNTLKRLVVSAERGETLHVVMPVRALLQYVVRRTDLSSQSVGFKVGLEYNLEETIAKLTGMGYERELMVEQRGQMSVRGGIFDVFPISSELPYRIEFFGDEIESIRRFEPETQRSVGPADKFQVLPRSEKRLLREAAAAAGMLTAVTDYLAPNALICVDEPTSVGAEARRIAGQFENSPFFMTIEEAHTHLEAFLRLSVAQIAYERTQDVPRVAAPIRSLTSWQPPAADFWQQLEQWDAADYTVVLLCNNAGERRRLHELLDERGYRLGDQRFDLRVELGRIRAGFVSEDDKLAVLSEREIFGRHYVRRTRRRFEAGAAITSFSDLRAGDYVVHAHHGIGRYLGLRRFEGKAGDFMALQYSGGDKLYVPVTHIDQVQKYTGGDGSVPKIDKLGGATWARTKSRVRKAVHDMTDELVKLYAARESQEGRAFSQDTPWQVEFEDAFQYDETPDQDRAIAEVKEDMQAPRPMDRLICGDVGFGKTEVALRAAFKAVMDGAQVAVLAPTTVLVQQHYATFSERLADYPVSVEALSRFASPAQQKRTIERIRSGEVDIVVGTHRLLGKDIAFKNLGLLVIDEEQRFGVAQKERLKQMRTHVDVITMSATPIPRTLNLSLMGARDMSLINTAPNDRLPIHTCIEVYDEGLIKEAVERELDRQGQVFFVHNRVQTILPFVGLVRRLVPHARVAVGHGQMPEHELERVMYAFIHHEIDVLVCTTIIGSGIDIPNANTIIINNAGGFGLSELYQLRGRVGRYKHRAFAYLLVPGERALTEDAQRRLKALEEFSTLGAGFRIAMRDLEIRGCGNILGGEQHGHIAAVGYETYVQLIQEAVADLKGQPIRRRTLPPFELAVDAYIPGEYVASEAQKITLYKRIAGAESVEEVEELRQELGDRFGKPPSPVQRLLDVMRVRAHAADVGAKRLLGAKQAVSVEFETARFFTRKARNALEQQFGSRLTFSSQDKPAVMLQLDPDRDDPIQAAEDLVKALAQV
jgi:transcription-repair coupling factor (superfamily II helicase)